MRNKRLQRWWRDEQGSQSLTAAGVSVAAAVAALGLLLGVLLIASPGMQRTRACAVAIISGGGNCGTGSDAAMPTGSSGDTTGAVREQPSGGEQAASIGLDVIPLVGEIKGLIEVFTGKDLVTGEDLGWWRFAGFAGLIGLNELKLLRHGDDLVRRVDDLDGLLRRADDAPRRIPCVGSRQRRGPGLAAPRVANPCGFQPGTASDALTGMRNNGGHAIRHLRDEGLIPNRGSLESQVEAFRRIAIPILERPAHTFDWKLGGTASRAFASRYNGQWVVIFVAKEGPYQSKVVSAVVPDANQIAQWGLK